MYEGMIRNCTSNMRALITMYLVYVKSQNSIESMQKKIKCMKLLGQMCDKRCCLRPRTNLKAPLYEMLNKLNEICNVCDI